MVSKTSEQIDVDERNEMCVHALLLTRQLLPLPTPALHLLQLGAEGQALLPVAPLRLGCTGCRTGSRSLALAGMVVPSSPSIALVVGVVASSVLGWRLRRRRCAASGGSSICSTTFVALIVAVALAVVAAASRPPAPTTRATICAAAAVHADQTIRRLVWCGSMQDRGRKRWRHSAWHAQISSPPASY